MTRKNADQFEYDVVLSFASQDQAVAEEFARLLTTKGIRVFRDEYQTADPEGGDFVTHIAELCRTRAYYCLMFISQHYPLKKWTAAERTSVQAHALRDANEYILPIQIDDTEVPGIREGKGHRDLREHSPESIVHLLEQKLAETKSRSGPPTRSHDLRSGNVPSSQDKP